MFFGILSPSEEMKFISLGSESDWNVGIDIGFRFGVQKQGELDHVRTTRMTN